MTLLLFVAAFVGSAYLSAHGVGGWGIAFWCVLLMVVAGAASSRAAEIEELEDRLAELEDQSFWRDGI